MPSRPRADGQRAVVVEWRKPQGRETPMPPARQGPEPPIYTFRVRLRFMPEVWREIEVAANQTLEDFGEAIPLAFRFTDPHLWSFFLSGKAWDRESEYALSDPNGGRGVRSAKRTRIRQVPFPGVTGKKE